MQDPLMSYVQQSRGKSAFVEIMSDCKVLGFIIWHRYRLGLSTARKKSQSVLLQSQRKQSLNAPMLCVLEQTQQLMAQTRRNQARYSFRTCHMHHVKLVST